MKKISLLKKLGLGLGTSATIVPLVFSLSSCANNAIDVQYISFDDYVANASGGVKEKIDVGHFDYDTLLLGSKKFFDGNYFLFVGSNMFSSTNKFFSGDEKCRNTELWFTDLLSDSFWNIDVKNRGSDQDIINTNFGFVTFIDDFNSEFLDEDGHKILLATKEQQPLEIVGAFDKWTDEMITQTKIYTRDQLGYDWDDESVSTSDYIRQDASAKAYREFCKRGLAFFPTVEGGRTKSFDVADGNQTSLMLVYKDGKLKDVLDLPTKPHGTEARTDNDPATLYGAIYKYFPLEEPEEPEPQN